MNSVTSRCVVLFCTVYTPACSPWSCSPHLEKGKAQFLYHSNLSYPLCYFFYLLDDSSKVQTLLLDSRVSYSLSNYNQSKARSSDNREHLFTGERLCFRTTMSTAIFRVKQKTCKEHYCHLSKKS